jgi:hypothetical protein
MAMVHGILTQPEHTCHQLWQSIYLSLRHVAGLFHVSGFGVSGFGGLWYPGTSVQLAQAEATPRLS